MSDLKFSIIFNAVTDAYNQAISQVQDGIKELINTASQFEVLNKQLEFAFSGMQGAGDAMEFARDTANRLGLDLLSTAQAYAKLAASTKGTTLEGEATKTMFLGVASAAATMGLSADQVNGVMLALSQIASKGVVSMEELRQQLGERLPGVMKISADAMGLTTAELNKLVASGNLASEDFLRPFGEEMLKVFGPTAASNLETINGKMNALNNELLDLRKAIVDAGAGDAFKAVFDALTNGAKDFGAELGSLDPKTVDLIKLAFEQLWGIAGEIISGLGDGLGGIGDTLNAVGLFVGALGEQFLGLEQAKEPLSGIEIILGSLGVALGYVSDGIYGIRLALNIINAVAQDTFSAIADTLSKVTFGELSEKFRKVSDDLGEAARQSYAQADELAQGFNSKAEAAMIRMGQTTKEAYQKAADDALAEINRINDGQASSGKSQEDSIHKIKAAFLDYATNSVKANDGVLTSTVENQAAMNSLAVSVDKDGKIIVQTLKEIEIAAALAGDGTEVGIERIKTSFGEVKVSAQTDTAAVRKSFDDLAKEAGISGIAAAKSVDDLALILSEAAAGSETAANQIGKALPEAIKKLNASEAAEFSTKFIAAMQAAGVSSDFLKERTLELTAQSAQAIGVDLATAFKGLSGEYKSNLAAVQGFQDSFGALESSGVNASLLIKNSLLELLDQAKNPAEIEAFRQKWEELGRTGRLAGQDLADGIQAARDKLEGMTPGINGVAEAFKLLGLVSREQSAQMAATYQQAFSLLESSGQATTAQLQEAFRKYATAAIAANLGVSDGYLEAKASALGLSLQVDNTGKVAIDSMQRTARATANAIPVTHGLSDGYREVGNAAAAAGQQAVGSIEQQIAASQKLRQEMAKARDEQLSKERGATVNSVDNLGGVGVAAYSVDNIVARLMSELGYDSNRAAVEGRRIMDGYVTTENNKGFLSKSFSNSGYVDAELQRLAQYTQTGKGLGGTLPDAVRPKTTNVNITAGGKSVSVNVPSDQESDFLSILEQSQRLT